MITSKGKHTFGCCSNGEMAQVLSQVLITLSEILIRNYYAISSVFQELFVIYAYRELFTSYTVSANQCTLRVKHLQRQLQNRKPTISVS